jgi:hypothetical protein
MANNNKNIKVRFVTSERAFFKTVIIPDAVLLCEKYDWDEMRLMVDELEEGYEAVLQLSGCEYGGDNEDAPEDAEVLLWAEWCDEENDPDKEYYFRTAYPAFLREEEAKRRGFFVW